jgi:hypothetical protein
LVIPSVPIPSVPLRKITWERTENRLNSGLSVPYVPGTRERTGTDGNGRERTEWEDTI